MKKIQQADLADKKVLVRVDFNVEIENGKPKEKYKIAACKETVDYLLEKKCKLALISHLGRPEPAGEGKINPEFSLGQIADDVENILGLRIKFVSDCVGESVGEALDALDENEVLLLENVRAHGEEERNDENFSRELAKNFDIFVNDAFSVSHRDQASVTGVTKFLPSFAGIWLQREISNLEKIKSNPDHPAVAIIGGAKIETKLPLIKKFEKNYDFVLVGSKIALEAKERGDQFSEKVIMPTDFSGGGMDIGPNTVQEFKRIISGAKTVVWNGPLGKFEQAPYDSGTKETLGAVLESGAFSVMGGGESVEVLEENNLLENISFVSTGGGAMLEFLSGNPMPGIEVLGKD